MYSCQVYKTSQLTQYKLGQYLSITLIIYKWWLNIGFTSLFEFSDWQVSYWFNKFYADVADFPIFYAHQFFLHQYWCKNVWNI